MVHEDYLSCSAYEGHDRIEDSDFTSFYHEESKRYFFAVLDADGKVLLKSEGYPQAAARENGIQSVSKNRGNRDFYSVKEENGKYYLSLRAANYREIARSCSCDSEAEAMALLPYVTGEQVRTAVVAEAAVAASAAERANDRREDNYLACREYEGRGDADENGIVKWQHSNGQYYFTWVNEDGSTKMRSEGYPTTAARDNGADSVVRNRDNKARYDVKDIGGRYFVVLKAGNHQEIARSCPKDSADAFGAWFPILGLAGAASVSAPVVETETVVETRGLEAEAPAVEASSLAAAVAATPEPPAPTAEPDVEDDYLPCKEYQGRNVNDKVNNVALFKHENGQYYFAIYHADGSVRLRSEGFRNAQERDSELSGVLRNLNNPDMYTTIRRGEYYIQVLKDKTGREVGRSCLQKDAPAPIVAPVAAAVAAVATAAVSAPEPAAPVVDVEDDYLPCKEYHGHTTSPRKGFTTFKSARTGKYYFAVVDEDGDVSLRSEGHPTEGERDADMADVVRNMFIKERYEIKQVGLSHHFIILRDEKGKEIARSCAYSDKSALFAAAPFLAPVVAAAAPAAAPIVAATAVAAAAATTIKKDDIKVAAPPQPVVEAALPVVEEVAEASSGFNWWWLLLPLLALLGWLLLGKGCNKEEVAAPAVTTTAPVVADTMRAVAPTPVAPAACPACTTSDDPIFTSVCDNPKKLNRLGSNPEFGNSHALSPVEFYNKLAKAHKNNDVDKVFLDRIFKGMGYTGFADAKPEMFSAVVLPVGTTGKLGYSKEHKTGCYTLPDDEYHRKAFHIDAANGCDFHFMKTCGNHFFFCK